MFDRLFLAHPRSMGESYGQHMMIACGFACAMIAGGLACFVHALIPGLFTRTGSDTIRQLHGRMGENRRGPRPELGEPSSAG